MKINWIVYLLLLPMLFAEHVFGTFFMNKQQVVGIYAVTSNAVRTACIQNIFQE